jgi:hypothetical protein
VTTTSSNRISLLWDQKLEPHFQNWHVRVARQFLAEEEQQGFRDYETHTDGVKGRPDWEVKLYGVIRYIRPEPAGVIDYIFEQLLRESPVGKTRRYISSHVVLLNGRQTDDLSGIKPGDVVEFVNTAPYSRRIEEWKRAPRRGRRLQKSEAKGKPTKYARWSLQAPSGVYRLVYGRAKRIFGTGVQLYYTFVPLPNGAKVWTGGVRSPRRQKDMRYPAIRVLI